MGVGACRMLRASRTPSALWPFVRRAAQLRPPTHPSRAASRADGAGCSPGGARRGPRRWPPLNQQAPQQVLPPCSNSISFHGHAILTLHQTVLQLLD